MASRARRPRWWWCATPPSASRCCCCAAPSAATTTAAPGSSLAAWSKPATAHCHAVAPGSTTPPPARGSACRRAGSTIRRRGSRMLRGGGPAARAGRARRAADLRAGTRCRPAIAAWRGPLHRGERRLADLCAQHGLMLAMDRLVYLSHWLTPPVRVEALRHPFLHRRGAPRRRSRATTTPSSSSSSGCVRPMRWREAQRSS